MTIKNTLRKVITGQKLTIKRTDLEQTLNYIISLEHEVRQLSRQRVVTIDIAVED